MRLTKNKTMKRSTLKFFLSMAVAMGFGVSANADMLYTFDTGAGVASTDTVPEAGGHMVAGTYTWQTYYGGEVQHTGTTGGWNLGGTGPKFEFGWPSQSVMQQWAQGLMSNPTGARIAFDVYVTDDWSFNVGTWADWDWYQLHIAFNSEGGWKQDPNGIDGKASSWGGNYDRSWDTSIVSSPHGGNDHVMHVDVTFADAGFTASSTWFQIFFGSNSGGDDAVQFFVDNIHVYAPEPSTLALAGLGAAAMLIFRRR